MEYTLISIAKLCSLYSMLCKAQFMSRFIACRWFIFWFRFCICFCSWRASYIWTPRVFDPFSRIWTPPSKTLLLGDKKDISYGRCLKLISLRVSLIERHANLGINKEKQRIVVQDDFWSWRLFIPSGKR